MGITIHYRGTFDDLKRIEEFEDRVVDLVLDLNGSGRVWRSFDDDRPERAVRGLIVDLFPGQDTLSLLISPEGRLVPLFDMQAAEKGELDEDTYCFCKTQFGPVEGHAALVALLSALKFEFMSDLEVHDESGYWDHRDYTQLSQNFHRNRALIAGLAEGLQKFSISPEAAEDPDILATRIERIARLVQQKMLRPARPRELPQFDDPDNEYDWDGTGGDEASWDAMYKYQRRRDEQMHRAITERIQRGESHMEALRNAMRELGIGPPTDSDSDTFDSDEAETWQDDETGDEYQREPWSDDDDLVEPWEDADAWAEEEEIPEYVENIYRLKNRVSAFYLKIARSLKNKEDPAGNAWDTFLTGMGDLQGGLAQASAGGSFFPLGLRIVQLKRAMRGAAIAFGATILLRSSQAMPDAEVERWRTLLNEVSDGITAGLVDLRERLEAASETEDETGDP